MAFHKTTDHIFFVLFLTVAVLTLPFVLSENIDCKGKAFHCVNSTHFKICVDFGGGVSKTVDDFQIPCPKNTACRDVNTFECELLVTTTLAPPQQSDATNEEVELSFTPFFEEGNGGKLLPEYKPDEKLESRSDNLRTTESSSSVTSEETTNFISSTRLNENTKQTTLSSENTISYNKQSDFSGSVTVPYTSESALNLVTNSDEFSMIITKIKKVNHTLQNSLTHNSSTNNTDDLSLEKSIQKIEGLNESTTEKNVRLVKIINSANINIANKNVYDNTTNHVPISTLTTETESLLTQREISENDTPYFTKSVSVTNDPNIFTQSVIVSSNLNIENIDNHSSVNVLNPVITTESYKTDRDQTTKSNDHTVTNAIQLYNSTLNSDVLTFNSSKNNFRKDSVNSSEENLSNFHNTHIYNTSINSVSEPSVNLISTGFTTTDVDSDNLSDGKELLSVLTHIPPIMSLNETFADSNEENNIKSSLLSSTTPFYKYDRFITHITSTEYEQNFEQNITHVPDSIHEYTDNITTTSGKQYQNNFTESETTTPSVDFLLKLLFNSTVRPIESDKVLTNPDLSISKIEIPIKLDKINKTVHNEEVSTDNLLLTNLDYTSYEKNISKTTNDNGVDDNETTLLNKNTDTDISLSVEIYNTSNSFESNLASLQETTINLKPRTNVTPLNISVNITSKTTLQYSSLPEHSTTTAVSEQTSPTISVTKTNTENNNYKAVDDNEITENKTTLLIESTFKVTTSLIETYNSTDTSKSNLASFRKTTIKFTPQNDTTSFNIDVDLNSKTTFQYTSFPKQLTSVSELHQNQTNLYSIVTKPNSFATDPNIENKVHMVVEDRNNLESKIILPNKIDDTSATSLKDTLYSTTESSDLILAPLPETQTNLTPLIDVTPLNDGVDFNSRVTPQYISLFHQTTTNVISEVYINQENTYSVTTSPRFRGNKMLTTAAAPVYSSIANKDKILDDVPYSDKSSSAEESVIKINNTNNDYLNLHSSSLVDSTERSSINQFTKQTLNMTTNSYISYTNSEKNQSQLHTFFTEKALHTTPLNVDLNISNISINKVNSTINSNLDNFNQSTIVSPFLKQDFTVIPFHENVDKVESNESSELTSIETTNSNLFITGNTESKKMYPIIQNSSLITNPHVYHMENITKVVSSQKETNLNDNDKNGTSLDIDINLPSITLNTLNSVSEVQDHNMSSSQVIFKSGTIPETISFTTQVTKTFKTNVLETTSHKTTSNKHNSNVINTNSNYVNSNNLTVTNNTIDDLLNNSHNVQKITQRKSNDTSILDTDNVISGLVNETTNEGFLLSKIFLLSSNHSSLKYENPLLLKQNGTNSNKKVSLLETNMEQNVSFENENLKNDSQQNTNNYYNDFQKQHIALSILSSLSNESKPNILDSNSQIIPLASQFSCFNRDRGKYSDKNNCTKFYICLGKLQPIYGMCPSDTVFSEINKQCTKNLSHCIRNNEFKCLSSGRFIDVLSENFYYICVKNLGGYTRFKLKCQKGYQLNKETIKCVCDSSSVESVSTTNSDVNTDEKISKEFKESEKYTKEFDCIKEGKFEYPDDCRKYFVCKKGSKSQLRRKIKKCDSDEVFNKEKRKCVDSDTYEC